MKKTLSLILLLCLGISASLSANGTSEASEIEKNSDGIISMKISTWTSNKDQIALLDSFVQEFAQLKGLEIKTEFETITFGEYTTKLSMELQGNEAPDAFWVLETTAPTFLASNLLADLTPALADYDPNDLSASAMSLWQKDGKTYGVPFSTSPFIILYNKDIFMKAGLDDPLQMKAKGDWDWESFRSACRTIKEKTGIYAYQTPDGQGYDARILQSLIPIIRSYGGDAWTGNGDIKINSKGSSEAVQLIHDMIYIDESIVPPGNQSDFYAGNAAMTMGQISRISKLKDADFSWGIISIPSGPNGFHPVIGQAAICANKNSRNGELAAELVAFMTNKSCTQRIAGIWPPIRESILNSDEFLSSNSNISSEQMQESVASSIKSGTVIPSHLMYPQIDVESKMVWDKLWKKDADVQSILDQIAAVYKKYIN